MAAHELPDNSGNKESPDNPLNALGPDAVDRMIRQAISICWMLLPEERRNAQTIASEIRRIVERAIANLVEDELVFGKKSLEKGSVAGGG
jgi:hypothetical protein